MRLLILGGTEFVGRHIAQTASGAGHAVTLFNRGSKPDVLPDLRRIIGDRDGGLTGLEGETFDAVIDVNGYLPRLVRDAAALLAPTVNRYLFISTISVYAEVAEPFADEDARVGVLDDPTTESIEGGTYGPLKAACESAVRDVFGAERATIVRPGLVVGRFDPTDRFTYWVRRVWRGGDMLAPEGPDVPMQWVDVRDLARFAVHLVEHDVAGVFNAVRPPDAVTMGQLLATAEAAAVLSGGGGRDGTSSPTWVDWEFLAEKDVRPWADLPAWLPSGGNDLLRLSSKRAVTAGLTTSPLLDTVADVLAWDAERGMPTLKAGLTAEREAELLAQWRSRA
ncbi:MAG TPA: NAD-dependent epimerase/dehydratase family protein [Trueperaceae bacterium]|nr:NAD-dependent epimerase/dehydratase family protein [Trueperaceae bacterium]